MSEISAQQPFRHDWQDTPDTFLFADEFQIAGPDLRRDLQRIRADQKLLAISRSGEYAVQAACKLRDGPKRDPRR